MTKATNFSGFWRNSAKFRFTGTAIIVVWILLEAMPTIAAPQRVRFMTFNVKSPNSDAKIQADIDKVKLQSDVIMFQEVQNIVVADFLDSDWAVYQVLNAVLGKREVALAYRKSVYSRVVAKGIEFGVDNNGEQLPDRYIVWAELELNNGREVRVMSLHFPPGSFAYLQPPMADNVVAFVNTITNPMMIGGDWNFNVNNDPLNIEGRTGLRSRGKGIDGFYYTEAAFRFVSITELTGLNVNSDHDPVQMISDIDSLSTVSDWAIY